MASHLDDVCEKPRMPREDEASVKCTMCSRPIPTEMAFKKDGSHFCCVAAAARHAQTNASVEAHYSRKKKNPLVALIKLIVILAILGGIGYAGYTYRDQIMEMAGMSKQAIDDKTERMQTEQ